MKVLFRLTVLMLVTLVLSSGAAFAATWKWVGSDDKVGFFFDINEICFGTKAQNNIWGEAPDYTMIICWIKTAYTPEGAAQYAESIGDSRYYQLDHIVDLVSISIPNKTFTIYSSAYYSTEGVVIDSSNLQHTVNILPDSWGEALYNDIVDYARTNKSILAGKTTGLPSFFY